MVSVDGNEEEDKEELKLGQVEFIKWATTLNLQAHSQPARNLHKTKETLSFYFSRMSVKDKRKIYKTTENKEYVI